MNVKSGPTTHRHREGRRPAGQTDASAQVTDAAERLKDDASRPVVASATRRIVAGFVAMVICLVILGVLASIIRRAQLNGVDRDISPYLHSFASPALDTVMNGATFISRVDPETALVTSYEPLVGCHGGLGGPQEEPFILYPRDWKLQRAVLEGAPAIYETLRAWLRLLDS